MISKFKRLTLVIAMIAMSCSVAKADAPETVKQSDHKAGATESTSVDPVKHEGTTVNCTPNGCAYGTYKVDCSCEYCRVGRAHKVRYGHSDGISLRGSGGHIHGDNAHGGRLGSGRLGGSYSLFGRLCGVLNYGMGLNREPGASGWGPNGCGGKGCPPIGVYQMTYPVNPDYFDGRDGNVHAAQGYGVPIAVPLAPVVRHQYNYSWGVPASRITHISNHAPHQMQGPNAVYGYHGSQYAGPGAYSGQGGTGYGPGTGAYCPQCQQQATGQ